MALLDADDLALSAQVLQEFYVQATRPSRTVPLTHAQAAGLIEAWLLRFPVQPITANLVTASLATQARFQISSWDAAIIEAARACGCDAVLSEDLKHTSTTAASA